MMDRNVEFGILTDVTVGQGCKIHDQVNLYKCEIGSGTKIDSFVYIEEDVAIGSNCTLRPFVFVPTGVTIEDEVFIGPNVTFTNDKYPSVGDDWELLETTVKNGASIGAGATICPHITVGPDATVGAGAVVVDDVLPGETVVGNPARSINDGGAR